MENFRLEKVAHLFTYLSIYVCLFVHLFIITVVALK